MSKAPALLEVITGCFRKALSVKVFIRKKQLVDRYREFYRQLRIVKSDTPFSRRTVEIIDLILKHRRLAHHHKTVGKSARHKHLPAVFRRKFYRKMPPEGRRITTQIDDNIHHSALRHSDELALSRSPGLIMQTASHSAVRPRLVILNEIYRTDMTLELVATKRFAKIAARISMSHRLDQPYS